MIPEITQLDLPIKIVVFDNSALGMVKLEMEVLGLPDYQTDLKNPNFAKVAEAMGMMGVRIKIQPIVLGAKEGA